MHRSMCIEGVIDTLTFAEGETNIRAALAELGLRLGDLLRSAPVFLCDMFDKVFTVLAHLRIQFEGMHDYFGVDRIAKPRHRELQRGQTDSTPRARYVGDKINSDWLFHCFPDDDHVLRHRFDTRATAAHSVAGFANACGTAGTDCILDEFRSEIIMVRRNSVVPMSQACVSPELQTLGNGE